MKKENPLRKIEQMKHHFASYPDIQCFLGLGSISSVDRMDDSSDIDFFLIVDEGRKTWFIDHLDWLRFEPLAFHFLNTKDGYKCMYADGTFLEFAVFEPKELEGIPFVGGTILYARTDFDENILSKEPKKMYQTSNEYHLNEALTNLYIGLLRDKRGEKTSAFLFIQVYAVDHVLHLLDGKLTSTPIEVDPFSVSRRIERKYPNDHQLIASMMQGYAKNQASALAIVTFLNQHYEINQPMYHKIIELVG